MYDFIWLLFAHYIGDCALQPDWMAEQKKKSWYVLFAHSMVWAAVVCIVLQYLGMLSLFKMIFLVLGHILIDWFKVKADKELPPGLSLFFDQVFHFCQLIIVYECNF